MIAPDADYWEVNQTAVEVIASAAVGFAVEVWEATVVTRAGRHTSYQIIPRSDRDGGAFWRWHLAHHHQWFPTPLKAAAAFVRAWQYFQRTVAEGTDYWPALLEQDV